MTDNPAPKQMLTDGQILEKFAMLHATIGLSATRLGYIACGSPGIIKSIQKGRRIHDRTRRQLTEMLAYVEAGHTDPLTPEMKAKLDLLGVKMPGHPDDVDDMES